MGLLFPIWIRTPKYLGRKVKGRILSFKRSSILMSPYSSKRKRKGGTGRERFFFSIYLASMFSAMHLFADNIVEKKESKYWSSKQPYFGLYFNRNLCSSQFKIWRQNQMEFGTNICIFPNLVMQFLALKPLQNVY